MGDTDKIGKEVYYLAQAMTIYGVAFDDAINELRLAYAEQLEKMARDAREGMKTK